MASSAAHGTLLKLGDGATAESFTTVATIRNITYNASTETIDTSNHDSASNVRTKIAGYRDPGSFSFEGLFDPANATHNEAANGLVDEFENRNISNWRMEFVEGSTLTLPGIVTDLTIDGPDGDALAFSGTITATGVETWA